MTNDLYELIGKVESELPASESDASGFEKDVNLICTAATKLLERHERLIALCDAYIQSQSPDCDESFEKRTLNKLKAHLELCATAEQRAEALLRVMG